MHIFKSLFHHFEIPPPQNNNSKNLLTKYLNNINIMTFDIKIIIISCT